MSKKKKSSISPIEQMKILYETVHATSKIMETLYDNDNIEDEEVIWRLNTVASFLFIAQSEIEYTMIVMEDNDVSAENNVPIQ